MKNLKKFFVIAVLLVTASLCFVGCNFTKPAPTEPVVPPTEPTTPTEPITPTPIAPITATFNGFDKIDETTFSIKVSNTTEYLNIATIASINASWKLTTDMQAQDEIPNKIATPLNIGDNIFYVLVCDGTDMQQYILQIRRRPIYEIIFDTDGGNTIDSQYIEEDDFAASPLEPIKVGYVFESWDRSFLTPVTGNITFKAKYHTITYSIKYYLDGGENSNNPNTYNIESETIMLSPAKRRGYIFDYWYTKDETIKVDQISKGTSGDLILYAAWKINENGIGSYDDPYVIYNSNQLTSLATQVNSGNRYLGKYFILTDDIDLQGVEWSPIGRSNDFYGNFDGNGFTISNFKITKVLGGLFGDNWGTIENLTVKNFTIKFTYSGSVTPIGAAGGLVGRNYGSVSNCYTEGNVYVAMTNTTSFSSTYGPNYGTAGGLIGYNDGIIKNCSAAGNVNSVGEIGGLVGTNARSGLIEYCNASSSVNSVPKSSGKPNIGGLVGTNLGEILKSYTKNNFGSNVSGFAIGGIAGTNGCGLIENCYSVSNINAQGTYVGGIAGQNSGTILNSYVAGNVCVSNDDDDLYVGGIVGENIFSGNNSYGIINNCFTYGNIFASSTKTGVIIKADGLAAKDDGLITNSFRYEEQVVETKRGSVISSIQSQSGTTCSLLQVNSFSFYVDVLNWDNNVWDIILLDYENGKYAVLNVTD